MPHENNRIDFGLFFGRVIVAVIVTDVIANADHRAVIQRVKCQQLRIRHLAIVRARFLISQADPEFRMAICINRG